MKLRGALFVDSKIDLSEFLKSFQMHVIKTVGTSNHSKGDINHEIYRYNYLGGNSRGSAVTD